MDALKKCKYCFYRFVILQYYRVNEVQLCRIVIDQVKLNKSPFNADCEESLGMSFNCNILWQYAHLHSFLFFKFF